MQIKIVVMDHIFRSNFLCFLLLNGLVNISYFYIYLLNSIFTDLMNELL